MMFKRNEDLYLKRALQHIEKTYDGHYVNDSNIQAVDLWEAQGSLLTTARDTAEKYLMRFGKKEGENLEDLYKAIHFIVMMIHVIEKKRAQEENVTAVTMTTSPLWGLTKPREAIFEPSCERGADSGGEDVVQETVYQTKTPPDDNLFSMENGEITERQNYHRRLLDKIQNNKEHLWPGMEPIGTYSGLKNKPDSYTGTLIERASKLISRAQDYKKK